MATTGNNAAPQSHNSQGSQVGKTSAGRSSGTPKVVGTQQIPNSSYLSEYQTILDRNNTNAIPLVTGSPSVRTTGLAPPNVPNASLGVAATNVNPASANVPSINRTRLVPSSRRNTQDSHLHSVNDNSVSHEHGSNSKRATFDAVRVSQIGAQGLLSPTVQSTHPASDDQHFRDQTTSTTLLPHTAEPPFINSPSGVGQHYTFVTPESESGGQVKNNRLPPLQVDTTTDSSHHIASPLPSSPTAAEAHSIHPNGVNTD